MQPLSNLNLQLAHQIFDERLTAARNDLINNEIVSKGGALALISLAEELARWHRAHPMPGGERNDGFALWMDAALLAKRKKDAGKLTFIEEAWWDTLKAWYLKIWDLQMLEARA